MPVTSALGKAETGRLGIQGRPKLRRELGTSLGYMNPVSNQTERSVVSIRSVQARNHGSSRRFFSKIMIRKELLYLTSFGGTVGVRKMTQ